MSKQDHTFPKASTATEQIGSIDDLINDMKDDLTVYLIDSASERRSRDKLVADWSKALNLAISNIGVNYHLLNAVLDSMDSFLNRSKK